jgi:hypothetical protein
VIDHKSFATREDFDAAVDADLTAARVEIVCLAGFMRILSSTLLLVVLLRCVTSVVGRTVGNLRVFVHRLVREEMARSSAQHSP